MGYRSTRKADSAVRFFWGVKIGGSSPQYFTNAPSDISYGGSTYSSDYLISIDNVGHSEDGIQEASVSISNGDGTLGTLASTVFYGADRNPNCTIYQWWYASTDTALATIQETITATVGRVEAVKWTSTTLSFTVRNITNSLASRAPWKGYGHVCPYAVDFKGEQCAATTLSYTSCGGTFQDCTDRSNTARFGGMRHSPKDGQTISYGQEGSFIIGPPPDIPAN